MPTSPGQTAGARFVPTRTLEVAVGRQPGRRAKRRAGLAVSGCYADLTPV